MTYRIKEPIPSGPFMRWLNDRIAESDVNTVCDRLGWQTLSRDAGARRMYRYRYGRSETRRGRLSSEGRKGRAVVLPATHFERSIVEDALHHAGVRLEDVYSRELYPALFEDIPLEAEMFCANCQDTCTPIRSTCPWCEGTILIRVA